MNMEIENLKIEEIKKTKNKTEIFYIKILKGRKCQTNHPVQAFYLIKRFIKN